jgi:hypothetical protein
MKHFKLHISISSQNRSQAVWPVVCFKGQAKDINHGFKDVDVR